LTSEQIAISRAAAIVIADVPRDELYEWSKMVGRAAKLSDIPQPWRDRIAKVMRGMERTAR
jgi:hypothetical protein